MKKVFLWMREHWMLTLAIGLVLGVAIGVGIAAAVAVPVIPFFAGFTVFGFAPFAAIGGWSVVAASFACAGIAAAAVATATALFNLVYTITHALNTVIVPAKNKNGDFFDEVDEVNDFDDEFSEPAGSSKKVNEVLISRKGCCADSADDKPEDDKSEDDKSEDDKSEDDKSEDDKSEDDKPVDDKPVDDKPVDDKPVDDKLVDDKSVGGKPVDDKPVDDKSVGGKSVDGKTGLKNSGGAGLFDTKSKPIPEPESSNLQSSKGL